MTGCVGVRRIKEKRFLETPHWCRSQRVEIWKDIFHNLVSVDRHNDLGMKILIEALQPGSQVNRLADHRILQAAGRTHAAASERAGMSANPDMHGLKLGVRI